MILCQEESVPTLFLGQLTPKGRSVTDLPKFEKLGAFYLGKPYDLESGTRSDDPLLYDSKDLTTHAVCVGMTGSGKTGLCLSLLEEAAIDGIPAIAIDPKGDLGNLLLTFPQLRPADFEPWVEESAAVREGMTRSQYAAHMAGVWKKGLGEWGQSPDRIGRFRDAVDIAIYTPGSNAGLPLTILRSFDAPPAEMLEDADAMRERVSSATSGLLALLGVDADPVQSREHILIANILDRAWRSGRSLDIGSLISEIQSPPMDRIGVIDLESFYPAKDRVGLAMRINNLLASPAFASWMEGEALNIKNLLYTKTGQPRLSIISIAHLSESERMFFVTILLNEVLAWVRTQPGTSSLRALLYMDEIFGYFPPTANPPSKRPMLTLLKQARAYGLGVVLASQNPVDLDYKGLSNTGTWFLGRLQTERDKARVLEGLEGAAASVGGNFDRQKMERTLAGLGSRVFLMNNVHEDEPVVFQTRWAMSFLRGPMTRQQISKLMATRREAESRTEEMPADTESSHGPPVTPPDVEVRYLPARVGGAGRLVYRPALLGKARVHFVKSTLGGIDHWENIRLLNVFRGELPDDVWEGGSALATEDERILEEGEQEADYSTLPAEMLRAKAYTSWASDLKNSLYREQRLIIWRCSSLKEYSEPEESEADFRVRLRQVTHERRDVEVEKLRKKYATKYASIESKMRTAQERIAREKSQAKQATLQSAISIGSSLLGALFGRKIASRTNVGKVSTSARSMGRASQQRDDVERAKERLEQLNEDLAKLESKCEDEIDKLEEHWTVDSLKLESSEIQPRKNDIEVAPVTLVWTPWRLSDDGFAEPAYETG